MVIGDVSNLPMYYCNTCGNDTLDISERLTASHHMILDIDYVLKISFQVFCVVLYTDFIFGTQSSLSIFTQKYLYKCEDTYFILQNKYLCIYQDSFGER